MVKIKGLLTPPKSFLDTWNPDLQHMLETLTKQQEALTLAELSTNAFDCRETQEMLDQFVKLYNRCKLVCQAVHGSEH